MKKIKTLFLYLLNLPLYWIARLVPKDENIWIFGSSLGRHFADNSKYLYLYLHQNKLTDSRKIVWITKNKDIYKYLNSLKLPCEYLYTFKGIYLTTRASKTFLTHSVHDINGALIGGSHIIQLWHGAPLKKIGYKGDWFPYGIIGKIKVMIYSGIFNFGYYMKCDILIASSKISKETFKEAFYISFNQKNKDDKILILGQPRNDVLKPNFNFDHKLFPEYSILNSHRSKYSKIVSWLPTHRKQLKKTIVDLMDDSKIDLSLLDGFCKDNNILFVIKAHFLELDLVKDLIDSCTNIITYDIADPYPLLHFTDILITDYSSVYFDFLVTNKPIIFAPFDFKVYKDATNFYYDYDEFTPGKKCMNWDEVKVEMQNIINGVDTFKHNRAKLLSDGGFVVDNNSKNIIEYFMQNDFKG